MLFPKNVGPDKTSMFVPAVGHTLNIYAVHIGLDEGEKKTQYCAVNVMDTGRVGGRTGLKYV